MLALPCIPIPIHRFGRFAGKKEKPLALDAIFRAKVAAPKNKGETQPRGRPVPTTTVTAIKMRQRESRNKERSDGGVRSMIKQEVQVHPRSPKVHGIDDDKLYTTK